VLSAAHRAVVASWNAFDVRRAHAVDGDDNEAELGEGLPVAASAGKRAAARGTGLRAGYTLLTTGYFRAGSKVVGRNSRP